MSKRPDFITSKDIAKWSKILDADSTLKNVPNIPELREVCYAGLYLSEQLEDLECPADLIVRIQYTAGVMSFGRDAWEITLMLLDKFKKQELEFEVDVDSAN